MAITIMKADVNMMTQAAENWVRNHSKQESRIRVAGEARQGVISLTMHGVVLPAEDGFKLLGVLYSIAPKGAKVAMAFPDNR